VSTEKPREIAVRVLQRRDRERQYVEDILEEELAHTALSSNDRRLVQELTYGVARWQATLDWLIDQKTKNRPQKTALSILLRLGLYQVFWLDRIPDHAAVHETVEIAKRLGFGPQAGFINAVLRGYLREQTPTRQRLDDLQKRQPALGFSHPEWLWVRWRERWGAEKAVQLLDWNNRPPRTFARVNTLRTDAGKLLDLWRAEGVEFDLFIRDWIDENLVFELKSHPPLAGLASFQQGSFYIQDPSTLLAVRELEPHAGDAVLDFCSAPGGKTTFLAQVMRNQGRIVAQDAQRNRLDRLRENCLRLGASCVDISPEGTIDAMPATLFDRVLLDAPCSNTGVMRRRVDLRWRIRPEEIGRLRILQLELLRRGASVLKPQGVLVYSTCSLESEENRSVVDEFLMQHPHFRLDRDHALLPFQDGVDGAYVARLIRVG
jgi:16S rRNA (cytosine967-C5)-methyltransferase